MFFSTAILTIGTIDQIEMLATTRLVLMCYTKQPRLISNLAGVPSSVQISECHLMGKQHFPPVGARNG